jgi:protein gp37
MADVFEPRSELDSWHARLWDLIQATPFLDWLLLTKRPERVRREVPWNGGWPVNVWLGTTAENQLWASRRVPIVLEHPAVVRFISCEPLLGPLNLRKWLGSASSGPGIDWVIAGGESGPKARAMDPRWVLNLRDQCVESNVPFHFRQWGNWRPDYTGSPPMAKRLSLGRQTGPTVNLIRLSKTAAGRELDGHTWDGFPVPRMTG